ncbi:hypothetical protein LT493_23115 [Streptomyces tricolor]|nr:hypothetical protein [Streptomyces tricolor]
MRDDDSCDPLARAAAHSFGIFAARRGVPGTDRRRAAAGVYGVTTERFLQEPGARRRRRTGGGGPGLSPGGGRRSARTANGPKS